MLRDDLKPHRELRSANANECKAGAETLSRKHLLTQRMFNSERNVRRWTVDEE